MATSGDIVNAGRQHRRPQKRSDDVVESACLGEYVFVRSANGLLSLRVKARYATRGQAVGEFCAKF